VEKLGPNDVSARLKYRANNRRTVSKVKNGHQPLDDGRTAASRQEQSLPNFLALHKLLLKNIEHHLVFASDRWVMRPDSQRSLHASRFL
jgi:hypothetical protein